MDPTYILKLQLGIKYIYIYIYIDETVTLIQNIKHTSALLCYDDVQLYDKLYKMYHDNHQHIHYKVLYVHSKISPTAEWSYEGREVAIKFT